MAMSLDKLWWTIFFVITVQKWKNRIVIVIVIVIEIDYYIVFYCCSRVYLKYMVFCFDYRCSDWFLRKWVLLFASPEQRSYQKEQSFATRKSSFKRTYGRTRRLFVWSCYWFFCVKNSKDTSWVKKYRVL